MIRPLHTAPSYPQQRHTANTGSGDEIAGKITVLRVSKVSRVSVKGTFPRVGAKLRVFSR